MEELSQISLGKRTSRLKEIYGESLELGENIDYLEEEVLQGLLVLCDNRVSEISSFVKENKLELQGIFHVEDLQSSLSYRLALFEKASSRDEKLLHCKTALEQFTDLKQAVRDYEQYSLNASEKIDSCFAEVEKILSNPSLAGLDLLDFREQFLLLKQLEKPYAVESVSRQCSSLLERLSVFAGSSETVYEAEKSFSELESFYKDFVSVQEHLSIFSKNTLKTIEKSFSSIAKFFDEGKLRISNATDLGSLNKEIQELEKFIEGEFSESVLKSFSESAQWVYDGNKTRLVLENNVYGLNRPVIVEIPLKAKGQITGISSNISKAFVRNALLFLDLNYVPLGPTIIEFEELSEDSNTPAQEPVVILQDETENNEASRLSSEEFSQKLQRLYLLRDSLIPENLDFFRDIFLSTTPEEMIDAKYIPPLSEDRISKIETELSTIVPLSLAKKLSDFERAFNEKDYDSAMEIAVSTEAELESKLALLESRKKELSIAVDSVKEEALASFNSAASEFNKGEHSPETEKKLEEAEKSLKEGDFINSILFSRNATALMSVPDSSDLSIPVAVIPIIVAAIAIAFIRLKRKKDNEKRKSLVKRVLQNW